MMTLQKKYFKLSLHTKLFSLLLLVALLPSALLCQSEPAATDTIPFESKNGFGFNIGFNASRVTATNFYGLNKLGLNVGVFYELDISNPILLEIGTGFTQKGTVKRANPEQGDFNQFIMRTDYVEAQAIIKRKLRNTLEAGLGVSYLLNHSESSTTAGGTAAVIFPVNKTEASVILGYHYYLNNVASVGVRVQHSITPIRSVVSAAPTNIFNRAQLHQLFTFLVKYNI